MKTFLFDVCHTLYRANTTFDFLEFFFAKKKTDEAARLQALLRQRRSLFGRLRARFGDFDQRTRLAVIALLEGESEATLRAAAKEFVASLKVIAPTTEKLMTASEAGHQVVLISASIDIVVDEVASHLGVAQTFSSKLAFKDGVCAGSLSQDLLGNKAPLIAQHFDAEETLMVTDNFSDASCIEVVSQLHPVYQTGNRRAAQFWRDKSTAPPICYE